MADPKQERIEEIFIRALELDGPERDTYLKSACAEDPVLFTKVSLLLEDHEQGASYLQRMQRQLQQVFPTEEPGLLPAGTELGPYRIERPLGSGGMARVYLAVRADGAFQQRVAIKIMKPGLNSSALLRRFRQERQILASLQHPHLTRILDGGLTPDGHPYFVMEYVEGVPITDYCEQEELTLRDRLLLFRQVTSAVAYAHQNLIVHRDLKPANILVAREGGVKLMDFGIAKLLADEPGPEAEGLTQTGMRFMTPLYASPEQVQGKAITTSTDIYQLGLVLYELLCGKPALELSGKDRAEREHLILEKEPIPPSQHIRDRDLRQRVRGDLDNLVLMALRKEPERRYSSVEQLESDLLAYLDDRPLIARSNTWAYRWGKFYRRNRVAVLALSIALLTLSGGLISTAWSARRTSLALEEERRARKRAEGVKRFMSAVLFAFGPDDLAVDPESGKLVPKANVEELLEKIIPEVPQYFAGFPEAGYDTYTMAGDFYLTLRRNRQAADLFQRALALCDSAMDCSPQEVFFPLRLWSMQQYWMGNVERADSGLQVCNRMLPRLPPASSWTQAQRAFLLANRGAVKAALGKLALADSLYTLGIKQYHNLPDSAFEEAFRFEYDLMLSGWAAVKIQRGAFARAVALADSAIVERSRNYGADHPSLDELYYRLAQAHLYQYRPDSAEKYLKRAIALNRSRAYPSRQTLTAALNDLAYVYGLQEKYREQESLSREVLSLKMEVLGPDHPYLAPTYVALGHALRNQRKLEDAGGAYRRALLISENNLPPQHQNLAAIRISLARLYLDQKKFIAARDLLEETQAAISESLPPGHQLKAFTYLFLGKSLIGMDQSQRALPWLRRALVAWEDLQRPQEISDTKGALVVAFRALGMADSVAVYSE